VVGHGNRHVRRAERESRSPNASNKLTQISSDEAWRTKYGAARGDIGTKVCSRRDARDADEAMT
jgi:hypothetical protein